MSARRSGQTPLSPERIIKATIAIVDADGLSALSMRRLGQRLGVDPSSIYYHVPSKSALYDLVVDAVMREIDLGSVDPAASPKVRLLAVLEAYRTALMSHPNALPLLSARPLITERSLEPAEYAMGAFLDAGLDHARAMAAVNACAYYVLGASMTYVGHFGGSEYGGAEADERYHSLPAERLPHLTAAMADDVGHLDFDSQFRLGAEAMVDGLIGSAKVRKRK